MHPFVIAGIAVTLAGLAGLIWAILKVGRARRAGLPDAELRAALQRAVALNMGALFLSALGLIMVVIGLLFS